jgi:hypothetical protein
MAVMRHERHIHHTPYAFFEGSVGDTEITKSRILPPQSAQFRLNDIAGRNPGKPHAITVSEASPMRSVLVWSATSSADAGAEKANRESFGPDRVVKNPAHTLSLSNRLVRF